MTIQECYEMLGGNYDEVIGRFKKETLVERFARKFPDDQSFSQLTSALEKGETELAFRAAHSLKGVCLNLSFTKLHDSTHEITELLRKGKITEAKEYFPTVKSDYGSTVSAIRLFEKNIEARLLPVWR